MRNRLQLAYACSRARMTAAMLCCGSSRPCLTRKSVAGGAALRCPTHRLTPARLSSAPVSLVSKTFLPSLRATVAKVRAAVKHNVARDEPHD